MKYATKIAIVTLILAVCQGIAQKQTTSGDPALEKLSPGAERARLNFLVGSYATETKIPASPSSPNGATGKGTSVITWTLDSMFLAIEEQSMNPMLGNYKGHGMLGFNAVTGQFELSMFNNFGDHPSYKGDFAGDTLVLMTKVPMPKHPFDQKLLWYKDGETIVLKVMNDFGKGFTTALEETSTPVSESAK